MLTVYELLDDKCDKILHSKATAELQPRSRSRFQGPAQLDSVLNCAKAENNLGAIKDEI